MMISILQNSTSVAASNLNNDKIIKIDDSTQHLKVYLDYRGDAQITNEIVAADILGYIARPGLTHFA